MTHKTALIGVRFCVFPCLLCSDEVYNYMMKIPSAFSPLLLAIVAVSLVGFHSLSASWTPPTATPPGNNVAAAVNIGSTTQVKVGNFMANIVAAATSTWSPRYCDELGNNCFTPATLSGGGWVAANQQIYSGSITGSGTGDTGGVDLNLSSIVGARETLVQLQVTTSDNTTNSFVFKPKGVAGVQGSTVGSGVGAGSAGLQLFGTANRMGYVTVTTNAAGIILMQSYATQNVTVRLVGYIGASGQSTSSPSGGTTGSGVVELIRALPGNSLPPPPAGLAEWPDYLVCDVNASQKHYTLPLSRVWVGTGVTYSPDGSGAASYWFNNDGSYWSRASLVANCGPNSVGSDIVSICNAGYCGYH
jgi:hypothetical protein